MVKRKTTGRLAQEAKQNANPDQSIRETQQAMHKDYFDEVKKCIAGHPEWKDPFYIAVLTKKERLMDNVLRNYFVARMSLPTPEWDQTVWRYNPRDGQLRFLWVLPDINTAMWMAQQPELMEPCHYELYNFVMQHLDQKLYPHWYKMFHGEQKEPDLLDTSYADHMTGTKTNILDNEGHVIKNVSTIEEGRAAMAGRGEEIKKKFEPFTG